MSGQAPSPAPAAAAADQAPLQAEPQAEPQEKLYTLETLAQHNSRESLWMLLHGKVYDITAFMDEHPGGDEVLMEEAGRDATEAFEDVGHSDESREMLPRMYLGEFQGEKKGKGKVAGATGSSSSSSDAMFPSWTIPVALVVVFLAWRIFLA